MTKRSLRLFGDAAVTVCGLEIAERAQLMAALAASPPPGAVDVVAGAGSVTVIASSPDVDLERLSGLLASMRLSPVSELDRGSHEIPVDFDGEDLGDVAAALGAAQETVVAALVASRLEVEMVGFVPGFAYLSGLPEELASVPRRAVPRTRVPAGSVALGGGYAGIYPRATPGGWRLVGRTATVLFDPDRAPFARLAPGDEVRLVPAGSIGPEEPRSGRDLLTAREGAAALVVVDRGSLSTVQDLGRDGVAAVGVPRAGAADARSARLANIAVGNRPESAVLEIAGTGPRLRLTEARNVVLVGEASLDVDGRRAAGDFVERVEAGQLVDVGAVASGARAYLAVAGGLEPPMAFGSRSSDLLAGLGPGPLLDGDAIALGAPGKSRARVEQPALSGVLRVLRVEGEGNGEAVQALCGALFTVGAASDRTGVRLLTSRRLPSLGPVPGSVAMVTGAVQLLAGGDVICLGVDHPTLGGYPVPAVVASVDAWQLGRLEPGDAVRFCEIDLETARSEWTRAAKLGRSQVSGWYPTAFA